MAILETIIANRQMDTKQFSFGKKYNPIQDVGLTMSRMWGFGESIKRKVIENY